MFGNKSLLFSHHLKHEHYRCLKFHIKGQKCNICARCTGIAIGTVLSVIFTLLAGPIPTWIALFGSIDWLLYRFGIWRGNNFIRVAAGICIGIFYTDWIISIIGWHIDLQLIGVSAVFGLIYLVGIKGVRNTHQ